MANRIDPIEMFNRRLKEDTVFITNSMRKWIEWWFGDSEKREEEYPELTQLETLKLIDVWLKITRLPMSVFVLLCSYNETGNSVGLHGYSYDSDILGSAEVAYLTEALKASIFADQVTINTNENSIDIDVSASLKPDAVSENFVLDLFIVIESLYGMADFTVANSI